jgi:hypothetical protein
MGCCGQSAVSAGAAVQDSGKRVNYTLGMLLGVDDFVQEAAYHGARRRELARELLGYGTARGLQVLLEPDGDLGPRLRVTPGMAWTPSGSPVCVAADQCCNLNAWLAAQATQVEQALAAAGSPPPASLTLHAVLSFAECLTDNVPIPGEPCRTEDALMQPSRVTDGFRLELRLRAPAQREEDAVRDFVDWIFAIPVGENSPPLTEEGFVEQVRTAALAWLQPTSPPLDPADFMFGAPPAATHSSDALLRIALRVWTTELRPLWRARFGCDGGAAASGSADDAVLLASLDVPLVGGAGGRQVDDSLAPADLQRLVDESRRPILLSLRMVQELVTQAPIPAAGDTVQLERTFGRAAKPGTSANYSREDHSHGTPVLPKLGGDLSGEIGAGRVDDLQGVRLKATGATDHQALLFTTGTGWAPGTVVTAIPALAGDLGGTLSANRVNALQSHPLDAQTPADGDTLVFTAGGMTRGAWKPGKPAVAIPPFGGDLTGSIGSERIQALQKVPLNAPGPITAGHVLTFDGRAWVPAAVPAATGDFVGRGAEPYEIVAAGQVLVNLGPRGRTATTEQSYGKLDALAVTGGSTNSRVVVDLRASVANAASLSAYVVKLTPLLDAAAKLDYLIYLVDPGVRVGSRNQIVFQVLLSANSQIVEGEFALRFQVEVSRFGGAR